MTLTYPLQLQTAKHKKE